MRLIGVSAMGIRTPIISEGDNLVSIVCDNVLNVYDNIAKKISESDVVGITEAVVAKAQGNFATINDIAADIKNKFGDAQSVAVVFPILSRNRFAHILKGIAMGTKSVKVLLPFPSDEVGNPVMDIDMLDDVSDKLQGLVSEADFREAIGEFVHPFTKIDYIELYKSLGDNIEIYFSNDPRDILSETKHVLVAEIHNRFRTKKRLLKAGAEQVYLLSDVLTEPINGSGYNPEYGVLGSNIASDIKLKLFPRECDEFVLKVQRMIFEKTGVNIHVLVYGDGAFKDPLCGIWELADPCVAPGFTKGLVGTPSEIKLKFIAENNFSHLRGEEKNAAIHDFIQTKGGRQKTYSEGTTPRKYTDLLGSLCDLMSGSGDKGTPVILVQGYFDDFSTF